MKESFRQYIEQFESLVNELGRNGSEKVYAHLLKGEPLSVSLFAEFFHLGTDKAEKILTSYAEVDDQGRVAGFFGLSLVPTPHKLTVKGKVLYTWCAMDAIILPQLLLLEALIESVDPLNGQRIQLSVNEDYLEWTDPVPLYISWMEKADSCNIRSSFCNHSHFFCK
jgi:alkylmercury lyase